MFGALLRKAQSSVDNAVSQIVGRVLIAIPFLVAAGFATAALHSRVSAIYGAEAANLGIAGLYTLLGIVTAIVVSSRGGDSQKMEAEPQPAAASEQSEPRRPMSATDRELLMAALTSAAPIVAPTVLRMVVRNLPLIAAVGAALFVMTQSSGSEPKAQANPPES